MWIIRAGMLSLATRTGHSWSLGRVGTPQRSGGCSLCGPRAAFRWRFNCSRALAGREQAETSLTCPHALSLEPELWDSSRLKSFIGRCHGPHRLLCCCKQERVVRASCTLIVKEGVNFPVLETPQCRELAWEQPKVPSPCPNQQRELMYSI